jgi:hypothetical protein
MDPPVQKSSVMVTAQDRECEDLATIVVWKVRLTISFWDLLFHALIRLFENPILLVLATLAQFPKLAIIIMDEVLRPFTASGGFPNLLCDPSVSRIEKKAKSEREIRCVIGRGVAGPDMLSMIM